MPRKQLDILYDLCCAHRDQDEARYQTVAQEFVRYLRWKGFQHKAQEFEELFQSPRPREAAYSPPGRGQGWVPECDELTNIVTHPQPLPGGEQRETHPQPLPGGEQRETHPQPLPGGEFTPEPQQGALFETAVSQPRPAINDRSQNARTLKRPHSGLQPASALSLGIDAQAAINDRSQNARTLKRPHSGLQPASALSLGIDAQSPAWQISQGAEINLLQAQRVLHELFRHPAKRYTTKDFAVILGYAPNKAEGFVRWLGYLGLVAGQPKQPTALARLIQEQDPYFEDAGTLWFLHYGVSSQPHLVIWHRIANQLLVRPQFTLADAKALLSDQAALHTANSFRTHLRKEFQVCTRAYLDAEFSRLHLLAVERGDDGAEVYRRTPAAPAPDEIVLAAILLYRARSAPDSAALEIPCLIAPENAPGRLLFLKEPQFRAALERLRLNGWITIESFADLDQIKFVRTTAYLECLQIYYQEKLGQG